MITKGEIFNQLKSMGAPQDKVVIVHSSLKAVGEVEGRAQGLLDVFIEYFTKNGGVLCIPAHTWHNFKKDITLDKNSDDTCVGTLSKIAILDKRGRRTSNPTHSLMLFGNKEKIAKMIDADEKVNKPTDKNGAYSKIEYVLLLGVGQEKNTYLHAVEEIIGVSNRLSSEPKIMKIKDYNGKIIDRPFYYIEEGDLGDVSTRFPKYEPAFRHYNGIVDGFIGNAKTQLCNAKILASVMSLIRKNSGGIELLSDNVPLEEKWYKGEDYGRT
ncbi:MAG: AAC(3) family N-acetyltransferase [Clostridia bacterium]|nr:AAC(3) family N-acetyltransferase [Clostridia bacterium]